jgi:hypothetical protein
MAAASLISQIYEAAVKELNKKNLVMGLNVQPITLLFAAFLNFRIAGLRCREGLISK